jgi:5-(carboxyamino)imidazole ribonucleotide synthase
MVTQSLKKGDFIGIMGGGQLARMMAVAASELGYKICVFTDKEDAPALEFANDVVVGDYTDLERLDEFSEKVSVVTFEFENLPAESLRYIEGKIPVRPSVESLFVSQDRLLEKAFFRSLDVPVADFYEIKGLEDLELYSKEFAHNAILKIVREGYDGKGQFVINENSNLAAIWKQAKASGKLVLERKIEFVKELSIISARDYKGGVVFYDLGENFHENGILRKSVVPALVGAEVVEKAQEIAGKILEKLEYVGVLAIEFFLTKDNELLVNEMAPRPHNSGHYTIDACDHSQFEQAIRAAVGLDVVVPKMLFRAEMVNLLGSEINDIVKLAENPQIKTHNYGKKAVVNGRKMGHYTVVSPF